MMKRLISLFLIILTFVGMLSGCELLLSDVPDVEYVPYVADESESLLAPNDVQSPENDNVSETGPPSSSKETTSSVTTTETTTTTATTTTKATTTKTTTTKTTTTKTTTTKTTTTTTAKPTTTTAAGIDKDGYYYSRDEVALYIHTYGWLPDNFITKAEARDLGWTGGSVERYAPEMAIGGSRFGNYEGALPTAKGRVYYECDIDTLGSSSRGAKRIVFSNDGLIYYTGDHYENFTLLYGQE